MIRVAPVEAVPRFEPTSQVAPLLFLLKRRLIPEETPGCCLRLAAEFWAF